jgi:hypothetical protein
MACWRVWRAGNHATTTEAPRTAANKQEEQSLGQLGDGSDRRGHHPHLAGRVQDEDPAWSPARLGQRLRAAREAWPRQAASAVKEYQRGGIGKAAIKLNDTCPVIEINPEIYEVRADGKS